MFTLARQFSTFMYAPLIITYYEKTLFDTQQKGMGYLGNPLFFPPTRANQIFWFSFNAHDFIYDFNIFSRKLQYEYVASFM